MYLSRVPIGNGFWGLTDIDGRAVLMGNNNACKKAQQDPSTTNVAKGDEDSDFALIGSSPVDHSNEWILDSSVPITCPNGEWFSDLTDIDGGAVLMGNNIGR